jgi:hypothetical protein
VAGAAVIDAIWGVAWAVIRDTVKTVWDLITQLIHAAIQLITGIIGIALDLITGHWSKAWNDMKTLSSQLLGDIISIIKTGVSGFGQLLFDAGKALVTGLINGITSMFGAVGNVVGSLAHKVAGFFGLSPAKEGPLSGGGAPFIRGQHFAQDLAAGMATGRGQLAGAAAGLAGAMAPRGGTGATGGGGQLVVEIHPPAGAAVLGQEFFTALANGIRVRGGDPRIVTRKVVFA